MSDKPQSFEDFKAEQTVRDKARGTERRALKRRVALRIGIPGAIAYATLWTIGTLLTVPGPLLVLMVTGGCHVVMLVAMRRLERRDALNERIES